ncbi:MAG: hypothetical protein ACI9CE_002037 [Flavobacterium sp.]|jgi:hypothetical protein
MIHFLKSLIVLALVILAAVAPARAEQQAHLFFDQLASLCGSQYVGEMTFPTEGQDSFKGKELMAYIKQCDGEQIRIPFAVGDDTSRTWVFTKTEKGVKLKHDHRHADGSVDEVSNYGGDSNSSGSVLSQSFPADEFTQALIPAASTNVWSITLSSDHKKMIYHLKRHDTPRFTAVLKLQVH